MLPEEQLRVRMDVSLLLQGEVPLMTGSAAVSGQFANEFGEVETELGVQTVPVFVVDSAQSLSLTPP